MERYFERCAVGVWVGTQFERLDEIREVQRHRKPRNACICVIGG